MATPNDVKLDPRKREVLLENWCPHGQRLYGQFFRHPAIADGRYAHTTPIQQMDPVAGWAESRNSMYSLGEERHGKCKAPWCPCCD